MARAMNCAVANVLFIRFAPPASYKAGAIVGSLHPMEASDAGIAMRYAAQVIVVPGYGLAVVQGQQKLFELLKLLQSAMVETFGQLLVIRDVAIPTPGPGQVLVKTEACGVCQTDLHAADRDWSLKPTLPFTPGHDGIGIVTALGSGVTAVKLGDRVGVPLLYSACGHREYCLSARETVCAEAKLDFLPA